LAVGKQKTLIKPRAHLCKVTVRFVSEKGKVYNVAVGGKRKVVNQKLFCLSRIIAFQSDFRARARTILNYHSRATARALL
jgi:propanediol utilization protein